MDMDAREDLAVLRGAEMRQDADAYRLVREARAIRPTERLRAGRSGRSGRVSRPRPLRSAVGLRLVRAGVWLGGSAPASDALRRSIR